MLKKFKKYIKENNLINPNDSVLVALSGGPDSVCMLNLICSIREEFKIKKIGAAHLNHMLRGEEANKDEAYAKELCEKLDVEFFSKRIDIDKLAKDRGVSTETAGRDARYNLFNEVKELKGYNKIATAHNANDQAETIIMRIMRGTGLEGLSGIPVFRDNLYIRPILNMERYEIEKYCEDNKLEPRIDKTNLENIYSRNKIRLDILPYMKEHFNKDVVRAINRMSLLLQEDNKFIKNYADKSFEKYCTLEDECIKIDEELFLEENAIITRVIRRALSFVSKSSYDFELKNIEDVMHLKSLGTNKRVDLPNGIYAENIYGKLHIRKNISKEREKFNEITINKENLDGKEIVVNDKILRFCIEKSQKNLKFNNNDLIKYFDYDKINKYVNVRTRKDGDKLIPFGMKSPKKLKDIFINMKIPKEERELIPILEFDNTIAWVVSVKLSDVYKVTKETKTILKISYERTR